MKLLYKTIFVCLFKFLAFDTIHAQVSWTQLRNYPGGGRYSPAAFSINGKGYMGLGIDSNNTTHKDWYEYNPGNDTWTLKGQFPGVGRWLAASFVINGKGYVVTGGSIGSGLLRETWEYDPTNDIWTQKTDFPGSVRQATFSYASDTYGYVGCGFVGGSSTADDFWQYNPATDSWLQRSNYPGKNRQGQFAFYISGSGYVGGGATLDADSIFNEVYQYNESNDTWAAKSSFIGPLQLESFSFSLNGNGYVLGGAAKVNGIARAYQGVYKYAPASDTWYQLNSFTGRGRGYFTGFTINDTIVFGTGSRSFTADSLLPDMWMSAGLNTGIENILGTVINVYPNPANSAICVSGENREIINSYKIYDVTGKLVRSDLHLMSDGKIDYDLSNLEKGVYILEAFDKNQGPLWKNKIVKE